MECFAPCASNKDRENIKTLKTASKTDKINEDNIYKQRIEEKINNPMEVSSSERREKETKEQSIRKDKEYKKNNNIHSQMNIDCQKQEKFNKDRENKNNNHSTLNIDCQKNNQGKKDKKHKKKNDNNPGMDIDNQNYNQSGKDKVYKNNNDDRSQVNLGNQNYNQNGKENEYKNKNDNHSTMNIDIQNYNQVGNNLEKNLGYQNIQDKERNLNKYSHQGAKKLNEEDEFIEEIMDKDYDDEDNEERKWQSQGYSYYKNKNIYEKEEYIPGIYGFRNTGNNCYLNSSLQLLTRVNGLKMNILKFDKDKINTDCITKGKLIKEFKKILNDIENKNNYVAIYPNDLKAVMGKVDERYYNFKQEDANEFISNFLNALLDETSDKSNFKEINNVNIKKKEVRDAYIKFYNKFYKRKGKSFLLDLFYGNFITVKYCQRCEDILSIKFNAFNMLELPIYELSKSKKYYSTLNINDILKLFFSESKIYDDICENCQQEEIYSQTYIYKLPENLIIFFGRSANEEYVNNTINYEKNLNLNDFLYDKELEKKYYSLDCVIEHSGNSESGHYTSLCQIKPNIWYYFSDSFFHKSRSGFNSENAIILLYKS